MTLMAAMLKGAQLRSLLVTESNEPASACDASEAAPDIETLVAELRARVESRRRAGAYPAGLEEEMTAHFQRILHQRRESRPVPDLAGHVQAAGQALPIRAGNIPLES